jgi:DDE domain
LLRQENPEWRSVEIRSRVYLNNIVEQDHRAIKRRCAPMRALKSFRTAAVTLAGVELAHRIRKRQFSFGRGSPRRFSSLKHLWARALAHHDFATLAKCFEKYALPLHPQKTRLIALHRPGSNDPPRSGPGEPRSFDFLGFTLHWGRSRKGHWVVRRKTRRIG